MDLFNEANNPLGLPVFTGPTTNIFEAGAQAVPRGGLRLAQAAAVTAGSLWPIHEDEETFNLKQNQSPEERDNILPTREDFYRFSDERLDPAIKSLTPDPESLSTSGNIVSALFELPLQLVGGPTGMVMTPTMTVGKELIDQGVDPTTATVAGVATGATMGAAIALPAAGQTLKQTALLVAANPVIGAGQDALTQQLLKSQGYEDQAEMFNPFDPATRSVDLVLGAVFGGLAQYGRWRSKAPQQVVDSIDAVGVKNQKDELSPFEAGDRKTQKAHSAAMDKATQDLAEGKPVDVSEQLREVNSQVEAEPSYTAELFRSDMQKVFGVTEDQADATLALVAARAKVLGQSVDEFISRNIAGIQDGLPDNNGQILYQRSNVEREQVNSFIDQALTNKQDQSKQELRPVVEREAADIKRAIGVDVGAYRHEINGSDLRHMLKRHGSAEEETARGQLPLTVEDLKRIPEIIDSYDRLEAGSSKGNRKSLRYVKKGNDGVVYYVEAVLENKKVLSGKTMWKKPSAGDDASTKSTPTHTSKTADGLTSSTKDTDILFQNREIVQPFYSKVLAEVEGLQQNKWNGEQLLGKLKKTPGVKGEELAWTGLDEYLANNQKVTREQVREFLQENQVRIDEVSPERTRYQSYALPGGENYRELLLTLPTKDTANFRSGHFEEENILAHMRFNERTGENGERVLHVEEIQSDWHQAGRSKGYQSEGGSVSDAPFKKNWQELALRRLLRWAAENGFDRLTLTTGEQQAARYDLSKQLKAVRYDFENGQYRITGQGVDGEIKSFGSYPEGNLEDALGKDLAGKMIESRKSGKNYQLFEGQDLKIGGEGMRGFYDKILTSYLDKFGKKFGTKISDIELPEAGRVHSLKITDAMRDSLLYEGTPLFQGEKGAVSFLADGRAMIHALESPDFSTLVHEIGHIFRKTLPKGEQNQIDQWLLSKVPGSKWERADEELFARTFERYLVEGNAPSKELQGVFDKFKTWLLEVYKRISGTAIDVNLSPQVKAVFDRMLFSEKLKKSVPDDVRVARENMKTVGDEMQQELRELAEVAEDMDPGFALIDALMVRSTNDAVSGFLNSPENVSKSLADLLETEAAALEASKAENMVVDGHVLEAMISDAADWYLQKNRDMNGSGSAMKKSSVVNALRRAARGDFARLTAGQQEMVLAALESIADQAQSMARDIDVQDLKIGDRFATPDLGQRVVVGEREGTLYLDNRQSLDLGDMVKIIGEVERPQGEQSGYDSPADFYLKEQGDFELQSGTDSEGNPLKRSAREYLNEARADLAKAEAQEHLYNRAALCLNLG